jgi:hypothetical protein
MNWSRRLFTASLLIALCCAGVAAQTTTFTYQGRLTDQSASASGAFDFEFRLFDTSGNQIGAAQTHEDVSVANGVFTVALDAAAFGANAFDGAPRFLEISVRRGAETGDFAALAPRQPITSTPYAIRAANAATADTATNALAVGGTAANQIIKEGDARLNDARQPAPNSSSYVQNQSSAPQDSTSFRIDGTGAANIFNASVQFNLGGNRILGGGGVDSLFVGRGAGANNGAAGIYNSFLGTRAGRDNTTGRFNSFFGTLAGGNNITGSENVFVGVNNGNQNTIGKNNSFFGTATGRANITGSYNTLLGHNADVTAGDLRFATAVGAGAMVSANDTIVIGKAAGTYDGAAHPADTVRIPGSLNIAGIGAASGFRANTGAPGSSDQGYAFAGDADTGMFRTASSGRISFYTNSSERLRLWEGPPFQVDVYGVLKVTTVNSGDYQNVQWDPATGLFYQDSSSRRFKENIAPLATDWNRLLLAAPRTYTRPGKPDRWEIGFIAEEFDELGLKPLVNYDAEGQPEGINYDKITLYLTRIAAGQSETIERGQKETAGLQQRLDAQEKQIETQQKQIDELKKLVCQTQPGAAICKRADQ